MRTTVFLFSFFFSGLVTCFAQQRIIKGTVLDEHSAPMEQANIFIKGTTEGTSSDEKGNFSFTTTQKEEFVLCVLMLGYTEFTVAISGEQTAPLLIKMKPNNVTLNDVVVIAGNYQLKGNSQWKGMSAVDLVTSGGSSGDLYRCLQSLPGTQIAAESGKMFVRGGDSRESQTYIDQMHVLSPYTTTSNNEPVRGRYSPFMFEGINFSTGGYSSEYAQGLSSVLPLTTKSSSPVDKTGFNPSSVGLAGGGTKAFTKGSISMNLSYENLGLYNKIYPDRLTWIKPYQLISGGTQLRFNPDENTVYKTYIGYDRTSFIQQMTSLQDNSERKFDLKEDNFYVNSTFQKETDSGRNYFAGAAFSFRKENIDGAIKSDDSFSDSEWELHLKTKTSRRMLSFLKLHVGAETFIHHYQTSYADSTSSQKGNINHSISALFATADINLTRNLNAEVSSRAEYTDINNSWNYNPRLALSYNLKGIHFSGIVGKYTQLPENKYLVRNSELLAENCIHYIGGIYHENNHKIYRVEAYYKRYNDLAREDADALESDGHGYSKGVDLFFNDQSLFKNMEYMLSYSFNLSKRKYAEYTELTVPQFWTKHNATLSLKYTVTALKSIIGITNRFASGRPYTDPTKAGVMNSTTSCYNSLDLSYTFLANKKLIIYASATNLLGRNNIYNYTYTKQTNSPGGYKSSPVIGSSDHFFYIGFFFTLSGKTAYDVSNF